MSLDRKLLLKGMATLDQAEAEGLRWVNTRVPGEIAVVMVRILTMLTSDDRLAVNIGNLAMAQLKRLVLLSEGEHP